MNDLNKANQKFGIVFDDERDFCRFASLLIGAVYVEAESALMRINSGALMGEQTYGKSHAIVVNTEEGKS